MLSHDLLEGIFARSALASDVEVVEEFPSRYDVELQRQHRWVRGDWQLLPWIFGFGTSNHSVVQKPSLPPLGRWKMLDNLRRSLAAPALLLSLIVGWVLPLRDAEIWTAFMLAVILVPPLLPVLAGLIPRRSGYSRRTPFQEPRARFRAGADPAAVHGLVPRPRRLSVSRRDLPLHLPLVHQPQESAGMGDVRAQRLSPRRLRARARAPADRQHLLRARRVCRGRCAIVRQPPDRDPVPRALGVLAHDGALGKPGARGRAASPDLGRRPRGAARRRAPDMAVLRAIRHGRRQHAAAGQFPGRSRCRWSRTARRPPISVFICAACWRRAISAGSERSRPSSASSRRCRHCKSSRASAAISSTGTIRALCSRSIRATSPLSTAEISSAIC